MGFSVDNIWQQFSKENKQIPSRNMLQSPCQAPQMILQKEGLRDVEKIFCMDYKNLNHW